MNKVKGKIPDNISRRDIGWIFGFMGTAVGAGILFLPLEAGLSGLVVFLFSAIVALPISYYSLKQVALLPFLAKENLDYTETVKYFSKPWVSFTISALYFLIFTFMLIAYSTALNNDIGNFFIHHARYSTQFVEHPAHSFLILFLLCLTIIVGEKILLRAMEILTLPLMLSIFIVSLILIPYWNFSHPFYIPSAGDFLKGLLKVIPLMAFTVLYYPTLSSMIKAYRKSYQDDNEIKKKSLKILFIAQIFLSSFISFFIFSVIMTLSPIEIEDALEKNISVMSVLAPKLSSLNSGPILEVVVPVIGIFALSSSFLGVILGAKEGARSLLKFFKVKLPDFVITITIGLFLWLTTLFNISVTGLLGLVLTPALAIVFFLASSIIFIRHASNQEELSFKKISYTLILFGFFLIVSYGIGSFLF